MTEMQKPTEGTSQNPILEPAVESFADRLKASGLTHAQIRVNTLKARDQRLSRLRQTMTEQRFYGVANTPAKYIGRRLKALLGEASAKAAIRAKCEDCVGYEEVTVRVGDCRSRSCELWSYRPYQDQQGKHPYHHD